MDQYISVCLPKEFRLIYFLNLILKWNDQNNDRYIIYLRSDNLRRVDPMIISIFFDIIRLHSV